MSSVDRTTVILTQERAINYLKAVIARENGAVARLAVAEQDLASLRAALSDKQLQIDELSCRLLDKERQIAEQALQLSQQDQIERSGSKNPSRKIRREARRVGRQILAFTKSIVAR